MRPLTTKKKIAVAGVSLTIAFAASAVAFPTQALTRPFLNEMSAVPQQVAHPTTTPAVSEKTKRRWQPAKPSARVVSEKLAGLWRAPRAASPAVGTGDGFDWGDAGIGAAVAVGSVLTAAAGVLTVRRRHGSLAQ